MTQTVFLSGHLKAFSRGELQIALPGRFATVGDALDALWAIHPALRDRVLNEQDEIREHVNIFIGTGDVRKRQGLATSLNSEEIHIFNAVSGG
jgi:molybdopterin synthase sulfur carrier subunit